MISTRNLDVLPPPDALRRLMQSMAVLDALLMEEWQYRFYAFNAAWSATEQMGSMRNGSGDDLFAVFDASGCFIKGFAHESPMTPHRTDPPAVWPGVLDDVPDCFAASLREPAFGMDDTTFCVWRRPSDDVWRIGAVEFPEGRDPDGSADLLSPYDGDPRSYREWAAEYYECEVPLDAVRRVYEHAPLTDELLASLGCSRSLDDLQEEIDEIGYPDVAPD